MTTSGITAFEMTARDLIQAALEDNTIIALGRTPKAAELEACVKRLNLMLKSMSVRANLTREATASGTIPAGTDELELGAGVQDVTAIRHVVSATHHRNLFLMARDHYQWIPNKASVGNPSSFTITRTISELTIKVWPVPAADIDIEYDYIRAVEVITDATQTIDIRPEFQDAIYSNLAVRCAGIFGAELKPELVARAQRLEREMYDADRPDSYYMESACA